VEKRGEVEALLKRSFSHGHIAYLTDVPRSSVARIAGASDDPEIRFWDTRACLR
jgi:hypothetical protein